MYWCSILLGSLIIFCWRFSHRRMCSLHARQCVQCSDDMTLTCSCNCCRGQTTIQRVNILSFSSSTFSTPVRNGDLPWSSSLLVLFLCVHATLPSTGCFIRFSRDLLIFGGINVFEKIHRNQTFKSVDQITGRLFFPWSILRVPFLFSSTRVCYCVSFFIRLHTGTGDGKGMRWEDRQTLSQESGYVGRPSGMGDVDETGLAGHGWYVAGKGMRWI